ncbi:hypothetical protein OTU49_015266 [Cherax quadricarinatus]|uniref:Uncharacterized protein n=1 Tax=Cherax quadricarinatus TaxID=27406 RepID=A0AAW0YEL9_CHEQU
MVYKYYIVCSFSSLNILIYLNIGATTRSTVGFVVADVCLSAHLSPMMFISTHISPMMFISAHISPLFIAAHISLMMFISAHTSPMKFIKYFCTPWPYNVHFYTHQPYDVHVCTHQPYDVHHFTKPAVFYFSHLKRGCSFQTHEQDFYYKELLSV